MPLLRRSVLALGVGLMRCASEACRPFLPFGAEDHRTANVSERGKIVRALCEVGLLAVQEKKRESHHLIDVRA